MFYARRLLTLVPVFCFVLAGCDTAPESDRQKTAADSASEETATPAAARTDAHVATGRVETVDTENEQIIIAHDRIESLGWPEMTMPFGVTAPDVFEGVEAGAEIEFTFREGQDGEYVVESIRPATGQ